MRVLPSAQIDGSTTSHHHSDSALEGLTPLPGRGVLVGHSNRGANESVDYLLVSNTKASEASDLDWLSCLHRTKATGREQGGLGKKAKCQPGGRIEGATTLSGKFEALEFARTMLLVDAMHEAGRRVNLIAVVCCSVSGISFAGAHVAPMRSLLVRYLRDTHDKRARV
ncbi:hypothetical protein B0J11DRAFT_511372 [Dendryphion nanum]|uniref:Uncharacterized protein n=1 Tax=Dendryphion nanum TaxID=256645 RepID=A0A9P9D7L7_9PLEO|nr:hypothetical protein B0J11DRAFT_511372 [Dendryphion nanum]